MIIKGKVPHFGLTQRCPTTPEGFRTHVLSYTDAHRVAEVDFTYSTRP